MRNDIRTYLNGMLEVRSPPCYFMWFLKLKFSSSFEISLRLFKRNKTDYGKQLFEALSSL